MANRPFRADHVGSMIRPTHLVEARAAHADGKIDRAQLKKVEDDCIREAIALQEAAGLRAVTDGEFRRSSWFRDFLLGFDNVKVAEGKLEIYFKNADGTLTTNKPNSMAVTGKITRSKPIQLDDFKFIKSVTKVTPKVCIPSPTLMHFRGGRENIDAKAYPAMKDFFADVAKAYQAEIADLIEAGLKYIQIDDTNLAYLCDENFRAAVKRIGEDPDKLPRLYVDLINDCLKGIPSDVTTAIHLCRGNASSGGIASGGYEPVAEALLGGLKVDGFFLEYDDARSGDFRPLRFLPKGRTVVLGLVTTKRPELEDKDLLKRRIDEAAKVVSLDQLALSPQCGFASGVGLTDRHRIVGIEQEKAKFARIVETAKEVWGGL
jgi:5-methyltetrahydropteroyltriglutamate--homocysteine methyltransferase